MHLLLFFAFSLLAAARDSESGFMRRACLSVRLFVCLSVCLSVAKLQKPDFLTKQFRAMVSVDDL